MSSVSIDSWSDFLALPWWEQIGFGVGIIGIVGATAFGFWMFFLNIVVAPLKSIFHVGDHNQLAGTAQVLSVKPTGTILNNTAHVCKFALRVQVPGREPYDVKIKQPIEVTDMSSIQRGETVSVRVSAKNPQKVRISGGGSGSSDFSSLTLDQKLAKVDEIRAHGDINDEEYELIRRNLTAGTTTVQVAQQTPNSGGGGGGEIPGVVALLGSGQRVPGVLMSFSASGHSTDSSFSIPELRDAPFYVLTVELHIPNLAPMTARNSQPVPPAVVPQLALGLQLTCAVDPASPAKLFAVDWAASG
jgi:hypothetical protein